MRAVIDTNLILSGMLWHGVPEHLIDAGLSERFDWLTSPQLLAELRRILGYPKFAPRLVERQTTPEQVLLDVEEIAEVVVTDAEIPDGVVRDPKDRMVLACAVGGKADYIVSGDKDLLVLTGFRGIPILSAAQFLAILAESDSKGQP